MPFPSIWSTYNILTFKNSRGHLVPRYEFSKNLLTMFPSVIPVPLVDFGFSPFCLSDYLRPVSRPNVRAAVRADRQLDERTDGQTGRFEQIRYPRIQILSLSENGRAKEST